VDSINVFVFWFDSKKRNPQKAMEQEQKDLTEEERLWIKAHRDFAETIDLDTEGEEDFRSWVQLKLPIAEFESKLNAIHRVDGLALVKTKEEQHIVVLNDLIHQGLIRLVPKEKS
jgi:hypothetical protein